MNNHWPIQFKIFLLLSILVVVYFVTAFSFYSSTNFEVEQVGIGFADRIGENGVKYQVHIYDEYAQRLKKRDWFDKLVPYRNISSGYGIHNSNFYEIEKIYIPYFQICLRMSEKKYPLRRETMTIIYADIQ